jgi:ankyrin repeat protein
MKIAILAIALGLLLLFGCLGQTNTAANNQTAGQGQANTTVNLTTEVNQTIISKNYTLDELLTAIRNDTTLAKSIIENGADVNSKTYEGLTPLMYAAANGKTDICTLLIEKGAYVNEKLYYPDIPQYKDEPKGQTALSFAISNGHTDTARLLINKGADVNARLLGTGYDGRTMLMEAIVQVRGSSSSVGVATDLVKLLIEKGADVNAKDDKGRTALMVINNWHADITKLLINTGMDLNARDTEMNKTALGWAIYRFGEDSEIVSILRQAGATE